MKSQSVRAGRATLAVKTAGEDGGAATPLVFLHAGVGDWRMWRGQMAALGRTRRAVAYDRRGFGETTYVSEDHTPADDLSAVLNATVGDRPAVLVGCSQGGRIAIDFALASPSRVAGLVLIGSAVSGAPETEPSAYPDAIKTLHTQIEAAEEARDHDAVNTLEARLWLDGPLAREGRVSGATRELFLDMNGRALRAPAAGKLLYAFDDAYARFGELKMPIHFVIGAHDFAEINGWARELSSVAPNAELTELKDAAHLPSLEQPEKTTAILRGFLEKHAL